MENTREIVLDGLLTFEKEPCFSNKLIKDILDKYDYLPVRDKAFMKRLFEGCIERRIELDYRIGMYSKVPVRKLKPLIRNLLRMGTYQIIYMDSVPDSAALNESVKLAKKRGFSSLSGFVNANLRSISRGREDFKWPDKKDFKNYLSVRYSVPEWLCENWMKEYGNDGAESLFAGLLKVRPVSIRFRRDLDSDRRKKLVDGFEKAGVNLTADDRLHYIYRAEHLDNIRELPGFEEGLFIIQDISSALAVEAAGIKPGDTVYDACAAPGGKTLLAAEIAGKEGKVISRDAASEKIPAMEENRARMKADTVIMQAWDATVTDAEMIEKADVLMLDVPCSGLGILGKKRDIKYNATPEGLESLKKLQWDIVSASWQYVKKGGRLLYSTCTINPGENGEQVSRILKELPFKQVGESVQLLPDRDDCDGFFYAVFERI